eukprot:m.175559 g.175559  ORF g.175559 m.175559 type:complete len:93 (+) comp14616_c0_seq2:123-401(+)
MEGVFPLEADPPLLQSTNTAPITHPQVGQEQPSDTLRQQQQAPPEVPLPSASADPQPESRAVVQKVGALCHPTCLKVEMSKACQLGEVFMCS